jgi:hypothetical protein
MQSYQQSQHWQRCRHESKHKKTQALQNRVMHPNPAEQRFSCRCHKHAGQCHACQCKTPEHAQALNPVMTCYFPVMLRQQHAATLGNVILCVVLQHALLAMSIPTARSTHNTDIAQNKIHTMY